ncbi:MAG: 4-hydroxy-tetrahydrodipicolinate reductase [Coriobacteriia bacterium]|nr:4-hydroxy-tetrahydrodipicolinate reductase [Coriobacteriia bacterium]MCL2537104.1 4-hydroxy-tetrahydrodipicolinate reductase [Coriobacteriia bacterium]
MTDTTNATAAMPRAIPVVVVGALGQMGLETVKAVGEASSLELVARIDPVLEGSGADDAFASLDALMAAGIVDPATQRTVLIDFTRPDVIEANLKAALPLGFDCVVGTTGLSAQQLDELRLLIAPDRCLFIAPNFAIGAVLMMQMAQKIMPFMPQAEVIEYHHDNKLDAPSGTAKRTAELLAEVRARTVPDYVDTIPGAETELPGCAGARGALVEGIPVHSVRLPGYVAHQEVIFGGLGQTLTVRHDSIHRNSFMPGVVLACEKVVEQSGLIIGLENLMESHT